MTMLLLLLSLVVGTFGKITEPPPFILAQPLPCACLNATTGFLQTGVPNSTAYTSRLGCLDLVLSQNGTNCGYPFPTNLGVPAGSFRCSEVIQGLWAWVVNDDLFIPNNQLADFCVSSVWVQGQLLVPPNSNISTWRRVDGKAGLPNPVLAVQRQSRDVPMLEAGYITTSGAVFSYGWVLLVIDNATATPNERTPRNGTSFEFIFNFGTTLDTSNRTQPWQGNRPGVQCQTLQLIPSFLRFPQGQLNSWSIIMTVFNQCNYDAYVFIVVMGSVGGFIVGASVIYVVIFIILKIRASKKQSLEAPKYVEMER